MKLTVFNGSPRGEKSNTGRLLDYFIEGFRADGENEVETVYIVQKRKQSSELLQHFREAENVLIGFPLYIDAMPGIVKEFFELLYSLKGRTDNPPMGFMVQNGFPETYHNRFIERYLEKFSGRMGSQYLGSILKGGCEGLDIQPAFLTEKYFRYFETIGTDFGKTGSFNPELLSKLAQPEHLTEKNLRQVIPFVNKALWDSRLEENMALERSFERPFL